MRAKSVFLVALAAALANVCVANAGSVPQAKAVSDSIEQAEAISVVTINRFKEDGPLPAPIPMSASDLVQSFAVRPPGEYSLNTFAMIKGELPADFRLQQPPVSAIIGTSICSAQSRAYFWAHRDDEIQILKVKEKSATQPRTSPATFAPK